MNPSASSAESIGSPIAREPLQSPRGTTIGHLRDLLQGRPVRLAAIALTVLYLTAVALLLSAGGCASTLPQLDAFENRYGVDLSMPFDNSRDEGPSYLVGPPGRQSVQSAQRW
jgi:hypothetical protein